MGEELELLDQLAWGGWGVVGRVTDLVILPEHRSVFWTFATEAQLLFSLGLGEGFLRGQEPGISQKVKSRVLPGKKPLLGRRASLCRDAVRVEGGAGFHGPEC